jgi:hypothetical protein
VANESGKVQTESRSDELWEMWRCGTAVHPKPDSRSCLERRAEQGESPVGEIREGELQYPEYLSLVLDREAG